MLPSMPTLRTKYPISPQSFFGYSTVLAKEIAWENSAASGSQKNWRGIIRSKTCSPRTERRCPRANRPRPYRPPAVPAFSRKGHLNQGLQTLYSLRPLNDPRWGRFVQRHAQSSIFHTAQWLDALHQTYRYEPIAITTCAPGAELDNALVFCQIESWLTG